ncbi:MAG: class I SAM-dependent methyltransferase [Asgard group archaeon]|nr:class I SAM-dependent methyltransferase [Asgard group archaeon]
MAEEYFKANELLWDEFAKAHYESDRYHVKEFLAGETTLKPIEIDEMGSVKGKTLLHLQCHFGLDTLSWVREGAIVTGVDFSGEGIRIAKLLTEKANLQANFIQSNIYDLPQVLDNKFDIVYTSFGVICWLNNLKKWGKIISHYLKPGGFLYLAEFHPFSMVFDEEHETELVLRYDYFHNPEPMVFEVEGTYAVKEVEIQNNVEYEWAHSLADVINALVEAGLEIQFLNEYPFTCYKMFNFCEKKEDGYWYLQNQEAEIPLIFTLKAVKNG